MTIKLPTLTLTPATLRKIGKWIGIALVALFLIGLGHQSGVKDANKANPTNRPSATVQAILDYAQQTGAKGCKVVYSADYSQYEVVCDRPIQITNLDADRDPQR